MPYPPSRHLNVLSMLCQLLRTCHMRPYACQHSSYQAEPCRCRHTRRLDYG